MRLPRHSRPLLEHDRQPGDDVVAVAEDERVNAGRPRPVRRDEVEVAPGVLLPAEAGDAVGDPAAGVHPEEEPEARRLPDVVDDPWWKLFTSF